jgi:DNA-directed RNA polymerase subunit RPC12/RpoP
MKTQKEYDIDGAVRACYNIVMFFIGIFGIEEKQKEMMKVGGIVCPDCGRRASATLYFCYTFFHFFYIPLFKWNKSYLVRLTCCGAVYECGDKAAEEIRRSGKIDFSKCKKRRDAQGYGLNCPYCGSRVAPGFSYCPYCGNKL